MPSSPSSSSPSQPLSQRLYSPWIVWLLRILVGATFVMSGFVKAIDPWGSIIKITEYINAWGIDVMPSLITLGAFALGAFEFIWGAMLFFGCYKRFSVWMLTLLMAFMLPLTLYILISSPVDDCGCFGDFIILSNSATFIKNVVLTFALVYLLIYNRHTSGCFTPYIQWIIGGLFTLYILIIELFGYTVQPLIDFRQYAAGSELITETEENDESPTIYEYTYTRNGEKKTFSIDNLPDSTWTFVSRELVSGEKPITTDGFTIIDDEGEDIAADVIDTEADQFIVTIPDIDSVDLSYTYLINDLNDFIVHHGGSLVALIDNNEDGYNRWQDISMASYPIYKADPKMLKELARGHAALVYLDKGRVVWKRSLSSIGYTLVNETPPSDLIDVLDPQIDNMLRIITVPFVIIILIILVLDRSGKLLAWHLRRRKLTEKS